MDKKPKSKKAIIIVGVIVAVLLFNPLSLYIYFLTIITILGNNSAKPELEKNYASLQIPNSCTFVEKKFVSGIIDSSPSIEATYKCEASGQAVYDSLAEVYKPTEEDVYDSSGSSVSFVPITDGFASAFGVPEPYRFGLFTNEQATKIKNIPKKSDMATPETQPVYLSVSVFQKYE